MGIGLRGHRPPWASVASGVYLILLRTAIVYKKLPEDLRTASIYGADGGTSKLKDLIGKVLS